MITLSIPTYPGEQMPLKETTHVIDRGTWSERWWINSYQTDHGIRWGANRHGVRLSGYASIDSLLSQLNSRPALGNWGASAA